MASTAASLYQESGGRAPSGV